VARAYDTAWPQEIFHETHAPPGVDFRKAYDPPQRANFFDFRADAVRSRPELMYPDLDARRTLFDLYLEYLRSAFPQDRCLIDVKYTSWHHLDGFWRSPTDPPGLVELIREKGISVIHLVRQNLFALYCSQRLAEKYNIWWMKTREGAVRAGGVLSNPGGLYDEKIETQEQPRRTLKIDLADCHDWMSRIAEEQTQFGKWVRPVHTLAYEELMKNGRFSKRIEEVFSDVFGRRPVRELTSTHIKVAPPLDQVIENIPAVARHFEGTEFEEYVSKSLRK
jgi:hypothetical protein